MVVEECDQKPTHSKLEEFLRIALDKAKIQNFIKSTIFFCHVDYRIEIC